MNKKDFAKLCFNFNKEPNEDLYELWEYNLRCYDGEELSRAINIIIANDKYFPTLSRVLEVVKDIVLKETFIKDESKYKNTKWYGKEIINQPIDKETQQEYTYQIINTEQYKKNYIGG